MVDGKLCVNVPLLDEVFIIYLEKESVLNPRNLILTLCCTKFALNALYILDHKNYVGIFCYFVYGCKSIAGHAIGNISAQYGVIA